MNEKMLLCSDLDRTILPNGPQPESPRARPLLRAFVGNSSVTLAYVSGRSETLVREAMDRFDLPRPDFVIGDVGTSLYEVGEGRFRRVQDWDRAIAEDWGGRESADLAELIGEPDGVRPQEPDKQGRFKRSYYVDPGLDRERLLSDLQGRLDDAGVRASLIYSVDEEAAVGLLDVLPRSATKVHAVRFLREREGVPIERTVFAGDSGNDLPALTSEIPAVLVANAREEVRQQAVRESADRDRLYVATGGFLGMNGNYAAGVLEGVAHFLEDARERLESLAQELG